MKSKQFAILGLGRFGQSIATSLLESGCQVLCCDRDIEIVNEMSKYGCHAVQADITDIHVLQEFGINNFDFVIIAIGENMESSILATMLTKELGAKFVISKAKNKLQKTILEKVGADRVVLPEMDMGKRIASTLASKNIIDYISLSEKFAILEVAPEKSWINKTIAESNIRAKVGINVVAIKRNEDIIVSPYPTEVIREDDILIAVGEAPYTQN